jgi:hypothetical protein
MSEQLSQKYQTNDPILLAALAEADAAEATTRSRGSSRYRGVSKNTNARSTTWSASICWGPKAEGHSYTLGTYSTEAEAALARNYAEDLLHRPNPVKNKVPLELTPDEATQKRVASRVVALLRAKGVLPPVAPQTPPVSAHRPTWPTWMTWTTRTSIDHSPIHQTFPKGKSQ